MVDKIESKETETQTWRQLATNSDMGLRVVDRKEVVYGRTYIFYDIYKGDLLIAIE